jgi:hypothetical protein
MRAPILMVVLCISSAAVAEPAKAPVPKAEQSAQNPPVVVASASDPSSGPALPQDNAVDPMKPVRHARVTTCRCGDQNPSN